MLALFAVFSLSKGEWSIHIAPFRLERYFAQWEFRAPYLLCSSDIEGYSLTELLALADEECRRLWQHLTLGYTESTGHPLLRQEIARLYTSIAADEVLTFAGAEEAIFTVMNVLLQAGDHAVVVWPGYQSLYEIARSCGADVTLLPLQPATWSLDIEQVRAALRPNTKVIVVNFPHNPTGALPDQSTFQQLLQLANEAGISLFSDEVYRGLEYEEHDRWPAAADCAPRSISLGVMSKVYGLAGLRIGWIATHDSELLRRAAAFKDYLSICNSAPAEILSLIALRARAQVLARSRAILMPNLGLLDRFFERWSEAFTWVRPRAGSIAFPRLCLDMPIEQFTAELIEQQGVLLLPGSVYEYTGNHFRLGFGRSNLPEALERLDYFMRQYQGA